MQRIEPWPDHDWQHCAEHGGRHNAEQLMHRVLPAPDQARYGRATTYPPPYNTDGTPRRPRE